VPAERDVKQIVYDPADFKRIVYGSLAYEVIAAYDLKGIPIVETREGRAFFVDKLTPTSEPGTWLAAHDSFAE
jgi:hypothetical protein